MTKNEKTQFQKHYQSALQRHLTRRSSGKPTSRAARALGREAVKLGLGVSELASVHDHSAVALDGGHASGNGEIPLSRVGVFLLEALQPVELAQREAYLAACQSRQAMEAQLAEEARRNSELLIRSRRLAHQFLLAQEEERKEISRELHDEVAQILAGINVRLAALREAGALNAQSMAERIEQTQLLVEQSVEVVHRYARKLRPAMLDDLGLIPALRSYIKDLPGRQGLAISFTSFPEVETLDNQRRTVLYRVAQEALTNVARHARATRVSVRIRKVGGAARLEVRDDGRSFAVDGVFASSISKRLGLLGMRERVEMVGGRFSIESKPGKGTTVRADIPLKGNDRPGAPL